MMSAFGPLFEVVSTPYQRGSQTSLEAARAIRRHVGPQAALVLRTLQAGSKTMHEVAQATGIALASVCARIDGLRKAGIVRQGQGTRKTPSGRSAAVWECV